LYLIELIVGKLTKKPSPPQTFTPVNPFTPITPVVPLAMPEEAPEECKHVFMPIDSSGETLACRNCGLLVDKKDLSKYNIFKAGSANMSS
jgi:hypothetical protein